MDKQQLTGAAFIDLKKAFDLVDHHCLLHKLQHYGVRGRSLTWFRNYLTIRSQKVQYGKELSSSLPLDFGVPQGSLLGPLLFVIYINDLPKCLMHSEISMYADDTVIYYTGSHVNVIRENLQEDLKRVEQWLTSNRLILNHSKTKGLLFGTRQLLQTSSDFVLQIQGKDIERVTKFNYLGVMLDEQLHWKEHVDSICKKVNKRLGILARIRSCLTLNAAKCVYNTLIEPILCYTDTVWGELSATSSKNLQRLQNRAARIVLRRDSSKDTLNVLGWVELETKRKRHKCTLVYKCLNNLVPKYLSGYFTRNFNVHNYNTRRRTDLHLPKPKLSLAKRTFRYSGSAFFNLLPRNIQNAKSLSSFRVLINTYNF